MKTEKAFAKYFAIVVIVCLLVVFILLAITAKDKESFFCILHKDFCEESCKIYCNLVAWGIPKENFSNFAEIVTCNCRK